jgi:hypothetical protein
MEQSVSIWIVVYLCEVVIIVKGIFNKYYNVAIKKANARKC